MKILLTIKALGAGPGGGAERILARIAGSLAARGHDVSVLSFDSPSAKDFYKVGRNVARIRLGLGQTTKRSNIFVTAQRLRSIRAAAKSLAPDVAIGFMHSSFIPLGLALVGSGIPVIGSERTSYNHYRTRRAERILLRASLPFLSRLTVNSDGVREGFPSAIASRMVVIPNPVAPAGALANAVGGRTKILLSVAGLRCEKDHETLLAAFAKIASAFPAWRLRLVGDGPLRKQLEAQSEELGLTAQIDFVGAVRNVSSEYRRAQLFVLPSIYEAFPNCLAEALAHGLPVIGFSDCSGTNELIVPGLNGLLAEGVDRVGSLASALSKAMGDERLRVRLAKTAPSTVTPFSPEAVTDLWEDMLQRTVSKILRD